MGHHTGVIYVDRWDAARKAGEAARGKQHFFRVWDGGQKTYVSKSFTEKRVGNEWVKDMQAGLHTGDIVSGTLPTSRLKTSFVSELRRRGRADRHIEDVERILGSAIEAGLDDMRSPKVLQQAKNWLADLRSAHPMYDLRTPTGVRRREAPELSPSTRNRYLIMLRALANYACALPRQDPLYLPSNPFASLGPTKDAKRLKPTFTIDELRLMVSPERQADPYFKRIMLLVYFGLRILESDHMRWEWFDWSARRVDVKVIEPCEDLPGGWWPKGRKERTITIQREAFDYFNKIKQDAGWVIEEGNQRGRSVDESTHRHFFRKYLNECKVTVGERTPHSTRHTWVSLMLASGENAPLVQVLAGHEVLSTTAGYAKSQERYREQVKKWKRGEFRLRV